MSAIVPWGDGGSVGVSAGEYRVGERRFSPPYVRDEWGVNHPDIRREDSAHALPKAPASIGA
jgi:hypothetical protein